MNILTKLSTALAMALISCQTLSAADTDIPALEQELEAAGIKAMMATDNYETEIRKILEAPASQFLRANAGKLRPYAVNEDWHNPDVDLFLQVLQKLTDTLESLPEEVEHLLDQMIEIYDNAANQLDPAIIAEKDQSDEEVAAAWDRLSKALQAKENASNESAG